jgi:hypothetical protein
VDGQVLLYSSKLSGNERGTGTRRYGFLEGGNLLQGRGRMSRDIAFEEDAICDGCGAAGAFDFMGDFLCEKCLLQMADEEDIEEWDDE